jgi:hypothetical protein
MFKCDVMTKPDSGNVRHHAIRTLSIDGGLWSVSHFCNLTPEDRVQVVYWVRTDFD